MANQGGPPQVFDNALPTPGLQAHAAVSRFVDHIPYYRLEQINARSGVRTPTRRRSRCSTPAGARALKAYMCAYARGAFEPDPGVVFDFCAGRGGQYPCAFLKGWAGTLVVDAYSGYDAVLSLD